jgi:hypothetical protein
VSLYFQRHPSLEHLNAVNIVNREFLQLLPSNPPGRAGHPCLVGRGERSPTAERVNPADTFQSQNAVVKPQCASYSIIGG